MYSLDGIDGGDNSALITDPMVSSGVVHTENLCFLVIVFAKAGIRSIAVVLIVELLQSQAGSFCL